MYSLKKVDGTGFLINAVQQVGEYSGPKAWFISTGQLFCFYFIFSVCLFVFVFVWGSYENLIGRPMKTGTGPVKRQFLNIEHCEDAMLHCCAARFSLLLTFIHRLN